MTSTSDTNAATVGSTTSEPIPATSASARPRISIETVVLDTDDPPLLAEFYAALLGWQIESTEEDWITIGDGSGLRGWTFSWRSITSLRRGRTMRYRNSSIWILTWTIWTRPLPTRSQLVPAAPPVATTRLTSSFFSTRAATRSVCVREARAGVTASTVRL